MKEHSAARLAMLSMVRTAFRLALAASATLLTACLATPTPGPTPTATSVPPTETPLPSATPAPAATATLFAPPIDLSAIRAVTNASAPATYDPERRVVSGLVPLRALALDDAARQLYIVAAAQQSPGALQLYRLDLESGAFTSGSILSDFAELDTMLVLPARGEEVGVLLSGCRGACGIWRVQLLGDEIVQLVDSPAPLRALHFMRDPRGGRMGITFLEPASEGGASGLLIKHDFAEEPFPMMFEAGSALQIPAEFGAPQDMLVVDFPEAQRVFVVLQDGEIYSGDVLPESAEPFTLERVGGVGEAAQPYRFMEGPQRVFPSIDARIILRFDKLEDSCGSYPQVLAEEVSIVAVDDEITLTRIAMSRTASGSFDDGTGTFQTLEVPGQAFSESYSGRVELDGSITGLYTVQRNECPARYAISGRLDPPPPVTLPHVRAQIAPEEGPPALGLLVAGQEGVAPWITFPAAVPEMSAQSLLARSGELTLAFGYENGIQVFRLFTR